MTRKDYILIADALKTAISNLNQSAQGSNTIPGVWEAAHVLGNSLARDNARFDIHRFLNAVGGK